ncbi:RNA polymerase sigma-70 factor, ECF subfamily [Gracilibacillus orientalis]|uniref:RNA polymerase sigma-70 factor, ECF subfamily n=1 Tax=Gracilibacillus orientalis TaxID=334253 RepID=A0A1I4L4E2_9BACI|nr:sigma-70 family RNA polymerase sigma factor [Gracilibacillus orientalis]SFL85875.1 RNA polymerase sigma-70 factor, ECF subfamily [Gracilibacillus orientalis]
MDYSHLYAMYKPLLFTVAYRMLGSIKDAEDIVHDVFMHLEKLDLSTIDDPKAYLAKMTTNKSLNYLQSSTKKREVYPGPWLPEPIVNPDANAPLENLLKEESISYAFVVLLHQLTELERCIYILRVVLTFDYAFISSILNRSEQSCRKVYSRAKQKLQQNKSFNKATKEEANELAKIFLRAVESGQFDPFIDYLSKDVVLVSDGGGKVLSAMYPIISKKRVVAFLQGIHKRGTFQGQLSIVKVNEEIGILQQQHDKPAKLLTFDYTEAGVQNIYIVMNPNKLKEIGHNFSF